MINEILKTIDEKATEEIDQKKEELILALEKEYDLSIKAKEQEQRSLALKKVAKEIEDFGKILQMKLNFKIQDEKNRLVKDVYEKAQKKIASLEDTDFKKLITHLAFFVPKNKQGHIVAGEKTAKALKEIVGKEIKIENSLSEEGFIFKSSDVEIDLKISQVAFQLQEVVNPELIKILFA